MEFSYLPQSIVNDVQSPLDFDSPYSFLAFIQYQNFNNIDVNKQLQDYQKYVNLWAKYKNLKKSQEKLLVRDAYVNLLREIALNFSTEEEKRFILNADFNDDSDLDIIIPFFIQKLKQISFYYKDKRSEVKNSFIKYNLKGSNFGVENIVKKIIYDYVENNLDTKRKELSSFYKNFNVSVDELYSNSEDFYDNEKNTPNTYTNQIDPQIFLNFKESIIEAISAYPLFLESSESDLLNSFSVNYNVSDTELDKLKNRDFIEYISNGVDSLKLNLFKSLYPKLIGTDYFYLSTNSQNNTVSGVLFKSSKFDGQFLNKHFPTSIFSPSLNELYTIYELGGFFTPKNQGILLYNTPNKTYQISTSSLEPDRLYVFPDPDKIGNTVYASDKENYNVPLTYVINKEWNRSKISNSYRLNDVLSNNYNQLFYGYQSKQQNIKASEEGIAKTEDNITFWGGDKDQVWKGSSNNDIYPIDNDLSDLLLKEGVAVDWYPDINGNEFALYKKINTYTKPTLSSFLTDFGIIANSNTEFQNLEKNNVSIFEKRKTIVGKIFVRNNIYNKVDNIVNTLSTIFLKYPKNIVSEIENKVVSFFVKNNIFIIETENYVVSDSYDYEIDLDIFRNNRTKPFYEKKEGVGKILDNFVNLWFDDENNKIFLVFLKTLENSLSASNYKYVTPEIYASDIDKLNYKKIYPLEDTVTIIYSLSTNRGDIPEINLVEYSGGSFRKNSFLNEFNLTYMARNLNALPFIVNEKLIYQPENNTFISETPLLFKPFYYVYDNNYANPTIPYYVRYVSNRSGYIGSKENNNLNMVETGRDAINYAFSSNVEVLQINETGTYIIQFDWQSYNNVNIFVGCSSFKVQEVNNNILLDMNSNLLYLTSYDENQTFFKFNKDNVEFTVDVKRPTFPSNEALLVRVYPTNGQSFSGNFCGENIYRKIKIVKTGLGIGNVITDPPCIYCGQDCEYLYPLNSTVTLVACAAKFSFFDGWSGDTPCVGSKNDCIFQIKDNATIYADFKLEPFFFLSVDSGLGRVVTLDGGINCPVQCFAPYPRGKFITLSASPPPPGYKFERFRGAPCQSGNRACTFIIYGNTFVQALYSEILYYNLKLFPVSEVFEYGPLFVNTIDGEKTLLSNEDENFLIFNPPPKGDIIWTLADGSSAIFCPENCRVNSLSEGTFVSLTAIAPEEFIFNKWIGGPCDDSKNNVCNFEIAKNESIVAYFSYPKFTVTVINSGGGNLRTWGSINGGQTPFGIDCVPRRRITTCQFDYTSGRMITMFSFACAGSTWLGVSSQDIGDQTNSNFSFRLTSNVTLTTLCLPFEFNQLLVYKMGPSRNRGYFETDPPSIINGIECGLTCRSVSARFITETEIIITPFLDNRTKIGYYYTDMPLTYQYVASSGISMSSPTVDINTGEEGLLFVDESFILDNPFLGAPYADINNGIDISYRQIDFTITEDIGVSAFMTPKILNV
jgi:hypothetical protein